AVDSQSPATARPRISPQASDSPNSPIPAPTSRSEVTDVSMPVAAFRIPQRTRNAPTAIASGPRVVPIVSPRPTFAPATQSAVPSHSPAMPQTAAGLGLRTASSRALSPRIAPAAVTTANDSHATTRKRTMYQELSRTAGSAAISSVAHTMAIAPRNANASTASRSPGRTRSVVSPAAATHRNQ